jgi:hypothetical protein
MNTMLPHGSDKSAPVGSFSRGHHIWRQNPHRSEIWV